MKIFGKYFAYHAKKSLGRFAIIAVLTLIYLLPQLAREAIYDPDKMDAYRIDLIIGRLLTDKLNSITFIMCVVCTILPILEFAGFHNRRNADTIFSMAISRPKLALAHFLNGAWQIVALVTCYTLMYADSVLAVAQERYDMMLFIPYYFAAVLTYIFLYSFFVLVFNIANNVPDGVVFMFFYTLAGFVFLEAIVCFYNEHLMSYQLIPSQNTIPYLLPAGVDANFYDALDYGYQLKFAFKDGWIFDDMIFPTIIAAVGTVIFVACLFLLFARKKAEKIEGISNSPFGYALLIPFYGISLSAIFGKVSDVTPLTTGGAAIIIAMAVGYMIYRRSFKLKVLDFIMIALACVMMFAVYPISQMFAT